MTEIPGGESISACADIDIPALRYRRKRNGMWNMLARQPMELYATAFAKIAFHEPNSLSDGSDPPGKEFYKKRQDMVIEKLIKHGVI